MKNKVIESFKCAGEGYIRAIAEESHLRIHLRATFLVGLLAYVTGIYNESMGVLAVIIAVVLGSELMNSAVERSVDGIYEGQIHPNAKKSKDMAAASVLVGAIISVAIGINIFARPIIGMFKGYRVIRIMEHVVFASLTTFLWSFLLWRKTEWGVWKQLFASVVLTLVVAALLYFFKMRF